MIWRKKNLTRSQQITSKDVTSHVIKVCIGISSHTSREYIYIYIYIHATNQILIFLFIFKKI